MTETAQSIVTDNGELDRSLRFTVKRHQGIAFYAYGWPQVWEPLCVDEETGESWEEDTRDGEWVDDQSQGRILAVMVGDDHKHLVDLDDITIIEREAYCAECGQVGCTADGLDRDD